MFLLLVNLLVTVVTRFIVVIAILLEYANLVLLKLKALSLCFLLLYLFENYHCKIQHRLRCMVVNYSMLISIQKSFQFVIGFIVYPAIIDPPCLTYLISALYLIFLIGFTGRLLPL